MSVAKEIERSRLSPNDFQGQSGMSDLSEYLNPLNRFYSHFLSGQCPLLSAAVRALRDQRIGELLDELRGPVWSKFLTRIDDAGRPYLFTPSGKTGPTSEIPNPRLTDESVTPDHYLPSAVLTARALTIRAALGDTNPDDLVRQALNILNRAWGFRFDQDLPQFPVPMRKQHLFQLDHSSESRRLNSEAFNRTAVSARLKHADRHHRLFQTLAGDYGWLNPALLMTAEEFASIVEAQVPDGQTAQGSQRHGHTVATSIALATGRDSGGRVLRLKLERIPAPVNAACGAFYPDPASMAYIKLLPSFQLGLQHAWWAEIGRHVDTCNFDIRWSLCFAGDKGECDRPDLLNDRARLHFPLSGRSAEAAFACALRAIREKQQLDEGIAVSASFLHPFTDDLTLAEVAGVDDKARAPEMRPGLEVRRIFEFITHDKNHWLNSHEPQIDPTTGNKIARLDHGQFTLVGARHLDRVYGRLCRFSQISEVYRRVMRKRSQTLLRELGKPYVRPRLVRRSENRYPKPDDRRKFRKERLRAAEQRGLFAGEHPRSRIVLFADSGFGKSTILVELESSLSQRCDGSISIRLGAGFRDFRRGRLSRLPLLSEEFFAGSVADVLRLMVERLIPSGLRKRYEVGELVEWLKHLVERGQVTFLLDALDQTRCEQSNLGQFLLSVEQCPTIVTGRPETTQTQSAFYAFQKSDWESLWVDGFGPSQIRRYCTRGLAPDETEAGNDLAESLLRDKHWRPLLRPPILAEQMKQLAQENQLSDLWTREGVYSKTLIRLVEKGLETLNDSIADSHFKQDDWTAREVITELLAEISWQMVKHEEITGRGGNRFVGEVSGASLTKLKQHLRSKNVSLRMLWQLGVTIRTALFDADGSRRRKSRKEMTKTEPGLAWRHLSFGEYFSGIKLAVLAASTNPDEIAEAEQVLEQSARDPRWRWIIRYALCYADREGLAGGRDRLAKWLMKYGAAFRLWHIAKNDYVSFSEPIDTLCRWLVHRDHDSKRAVLDREQRPDVNESVAKILLTMFSVDDDGRPRYRDSRWLHPAWELVEVGCRSMDESVQRICIAIREQFLSEFEQRVEAAAKRNQGRSRGEWLPDDRGLLELVPDDDLVDLGLLTGEDLKAIREWPTDVAEDFRQRRDEFHRRLNSTGANYCQCPPVAWEHPHGDYVEPYRCRVHGPEDKVNESHVLPAGYLLQRTPVTNRQFETFDSSHRRLRWMRWSRGPDDRLDDHPVVDVNWYQALMCTIWLTGRGRFGRIQLPHEHNWEACCRAGRDRKGEEFGIPRCDEGGLPVLDANGQERFGSLSSHGANFDGNYPYGRAAKKPVSQGNDPRWRVCGKWIRRSRPARADVGMADQLS